MDPNSRNLWAATSAAQLKNLFLSFLKSDFQIERVFFAGPQTVNGYFEYQICDDESFFLEQHQKSDLCEKFIEDFIHEYQWWIKLEEVKSLLYIDDLTGLFNFKYLQESLSKEVRRAHRYKKSFSILFIDIDYFKSINDLYGHLTGSLVLQQIARALKLELREIDSIARYGGDEFVTLLLETDSKKAFIVANRLRHMIKKMIFGKTETPIKISVSIGIASYPEHGEEPLVLLQKADEGMYKSKKSGRDKVSFVTSF